MRLVRNLTFVLALFLTAATVVAGQPEKAAKLYADGKTLLANGDFDGALAAFEAAAKADPDELNHGVRAAILKRVIMMRKSLSTLEDGPKWLPTVQALHAYYMDNHVYSEALAIGEKLHARQASEASAILLARTHLAMKDNAAATRVINGVTPPADSPEAHVLLGVALARQGELSEARLHADKAALTDPPDARLLFDLARLHTLLGNPGEAQRTLIACFENTPPSRLSAVKADATDNVDLIALRNTADFAAALETTSKVPESSCSSGASCDSCPSRSSCGSEEPKKQDKP